MLTADLGAIDFTTPAPVSRALLLLLNCLSERNQIAATHAFYNQFLPALRLANSTHFFDPNLQQDTADALELVSISLAEELDGHIGYHSRLLQLLRHRFSRTYTCGTCNTVYPIQITNPSNTLFYVSLHISNVNAPTKLSALLTLHLENPPPEEGLRDLACGHPIVLPIYHLYLPPPNVLLRLHRTQLNPISQQAQKLHTCVQINKILSLPVDIFNERGQFCHVHSATYDLTAVIVHLGPTPSSGHYVIYQPLQNDTWLRVSDDSTTFVPELTAAQEVNTNAVFCAFRERE